MHEFIVMPNHIHGIIEITFNKNKDSEIGKFQSPSQSIGAIIRGYKIATIKKIKDRILNSKNSEGLESSPSNLISGEIEIAPIGTGELESSLSNLRTGEIEIAIISTGELQFAPTAPAAATEKIKQLDFKIWQRNFYESIIRTEQSYNNISNYIINNPAKWAENKFHK
jgi:REP element-mobilizing transposase RayT